jgi:IclR family transcriptional regulator, pca regulon regulatory protein
MMPSTTDDAAVRSVRRALAVLRAFGPEDQSLPLGEIARRAGLDKATARRLLRTLIGERLIEQQGPSRDYSLGLGVLALTIGPTPADALRRRALPLLVDIAEATAAAAYLVVQHIGAALCIAAVGSEPPVPGPWVIGEQRPLNTCAVSRVLMAYLPLEERMAALSGRLPALTPATPTDPFQLSGLLDTIRQREWDVGLGDVVAGVATVGLPVRRSGGEVVAALGIAAAEHVVMEGGRPRYLDVLRAKVRELERRLARPLAPLTGGARAPN